MKLIQECKSAGGWSRIDVPSSDPKRDPYPVLMPPWEDKDPWCSCPGFIYRGTCRHVREAAKRVCGWTEENSTLAQTPEQRTQYICPKCEGPTRVIAYDD